MKLDCSIVIVSWNVRDLLDQCLQSVLSSMESGGYTYEIIVVDNASHDQTPALVRQKFPMVQLIETGANLGFAQGVNRGLEVAQGRWLCVLNPDTVVQTDALPLLLHWARLLPHAVVLGPRLVYADGTQQSSRRRWPTPLTLFMESTLLERWWPHNRWAQRYHMHDLPYADQPQQVDWLVGAVLLVAHKAIKTAGGLDSRFWMYSEELEWQQRLAQSGSIWYIPQAQVIHYEGQSSAQVPARKHIAFQQSKLRYTNQRFGPALATMLHLFLLCSYSFEWVTETIKLLLGHKPTLRRERRQIYRQVLKALWP